MPNHWQHVNAYRDEHERAERLWKIVVLYQDLSEPEAEG